MPYEFITDDWSLIAAGDHIVVDNMWVRVVSAENVMDWKIRLTIWSPDRGERRIDADPDRRVRIRSFSDSSVLQEYEQPENPADERAEPIPKGEWFRVLGFPCVPGDISLAEGRYKALVKVYHPDRGGDHESMARLNNAIQQARRHFSLDRRE